LINDYGSDFCVDHDDGSAYYEDSYNFNMYGGTKNFLGHTKTNHHQLFVYADVHPGYGQPVCLQDDSDHNYDDHWYQNQCILLSHNVPYDISYCNPNNLGEISPPQNNTFYTPDGTISFKCGSTAYSLQQWQQLGFDQGSTIQKTPDVSTVIQWGKQVLYLKNGKDVTANS